MSSSTSSTTKPAIFIKLSSPLFLRFSAITCQHATLQSDSPAAASCSEKLGGKIDCGKSTVPCGFPGLSTAWLAHAQDFARFLCPFDENGWELFRGDHRLHRAAWANDVESVTRLLNEGY